MSAENLPPPPRSVEIKPSAVWGRVLLWIVLAGIALGCPYGLTQQVARLDRLKNTGITVMANVLGSHKYAGKSTTYYLQLAFTQSGVSYRGEREVLWSVYNQYANSAQVPVITTPGNPLDFEVGSITKSTYDATRTPWLALGGLFGFLFLIFCSLFEYQLQRERRLLSVGKVASGNVTKVTLGRGATLKYEFMVDGYVASGSVSRYSSMTTYKVSDPIEILYNPENRADSVPAKGIQLLQIRS
jgi:hypothetical protein